MALTELDRHLAEFALDRPQRCSIVGQRCGDDFEWYVAHVASESDQHAIDALKRASFEINYRMHEEFRLVPKRVVAEAA